MAVGFKLSNVLSFELIEEKRLIITTKHIIYEVDFDDFKKSEEFQKYIDLIVKKEKEKLVVNGSARKRKPFYLEESRNDEVMG
jgi:hypothetical protein